MPGDGGILLLRKVPDDNSCLFSAIGVVFEGGIDAAQKLRKGVSPLFELVPDRRAESSGGRYDT